QHILFNLAIATRFEHCCERSRSCWAAFGFISWGGDRPSYPLSDRSMKDPGTKCDRYHIFVKQSHYAILEQRAIALPSLLSDRPMTDPGTKSNRPPCPLSDRTIQAPRRKRDRPLIFVDQQHHIKGIVYLSKH
ncbi:MAG: hypothetical protein F6K16_32480, partial [Symploca sp. SIO2B6]|nr:hypothetical protein [Symploca sp. SIO2B6]